MTEEQKTLFSDAFKARGEGVEKGEFAAVWEAAPEDDRAAVIATINAISDTNEEAYEGIMEWWAEALQDLVGKKFQPDDLPAHLANFEAISDYIEHVETTPFHFGLL